MADPKRVTLPAPTNGIDVDSSPESADPRTARVLANFLVDRPGKVIMRGPVNDFVTFYTGSVGPKPVAYWVHNDKLLIGKRAASVTAFRDPWVSPYRKTTSAAVLSGSNLTLHHVDLLTGTVTDVAATQSQVPGPRFVRAGDSVYGIAFADASSISTNGGVHKINRLLRWDGTTTAPTLYNNAPDGCQDIALHYERLFMLGGRPPGGVGQLQWNTLWFSDPVGDAALTDAATAWQDDTSGLTNQIIVGAQDSTDFGVAMAKIGDNLAIFKRRSIYVMRGYSPSTFLIDQFAEGIGCVDPRSVCEYEDGCLFMSQDGLMWFDGTQLLNLSENRINSTLLPLMHQTVGDEGAEGGYVTVSKLTNGYVMVNVGINNSIDLVFNGNNLFSALLHVRTGRWITFSTSAMTDTGPYTVVNTTTRTYMSDDNALARADTVTQPEKASEAERGIDDDGVERPIQSEWESSIASLAAPDFMAQVNSVMLDYLFKIDGGASDTGTDGWSVTVRDGNGIALQASYEVPAQADPVTTQFPIRRRYRTDLFAETQEVQVDVVWAGAATPLSEAALFGAHITYQPTRQRPADF